MSVVCRLRVCVGGCRLRVCMALSEGGEGAQSWPEGRETRSHGGGRTQRATSVICGACCGGARGGGAFRVQVLAAKSVRPGLLIDAGEMPEVSAEV